MRLPLILASFSALLVLTPAARAVTGQVELEIVGDTQLGAGLSFQEWGRSLSAAGVQDFRLRAGHDGDKPGIEVGGTAQMPIYRVTAVIVPGDVLIVPGGRFRRSDAKQLAAWLDDLAKRGPPDKREKIGAFGLTGSQFEKVNTDLAKAVGFSTKNMTRSDAVNKIASQLGLRLTIENALTDGDDKIEEELSELSCGTALACILRPIGFCIVPREAGETLAYTVKKADLDHAVWPIGWPVENGPKVLPGMYEFHNVNVPNNRATQVLAAISANLKVPVLYDHNALARLEFDLEKAFVTHPQARTTYSLALRRMLAKAGLKFELRVDEAGKPFLWVSTMKSV